MLDGSGIVALSWLPPSSIGDAPVELYPIWRDDVLVVEVQAASSRYGDRNLPATGAGRLTFRVMATNTYGASTLSEPATVALPALLPPPTPAAPVGVRATPRYAPLRSAG
jgi:hypothetical protein